MDIKSITAVASGQADDASVLAAAAALAKSFSASVIVIPAFADPAADFVSYGAGLRHVPADVLARLAESERARQSSIEELAAATARREGLEPEAMSVKKRELLPAISLAHEAVLADLVVMGGEAVRTLALGALFAETLISARAPVLLVKGDQFAFSRAAIAWDGSPTAGRAVRAALPLLRQMKAVSVLTHADDDDARRAADAEALRAYLARHGVTDVSVRSVTGRSVPASLLQAAKADGCGWFVAGGYGRPRLYELILGGATREFAHAQGLPHVLLAH